MASKLPHPSSGDDFRKFRDRVRVSPPTGQIDHKWIMDYLGFTQRSNAGAFLSALEATGFVVDGLLSPRGEMLLLASDSSEYRQAMSEAIDELLGKERADSIRAGLLPNLPGYLQQQFKVGKTVVDKFFGGLRWLATEAGDDAVLAACPASRASTPRATVNGEPRATKGVGSSRPPATLNSRQKAGGQEKSPDQAKLHDLDQANGHRSQLLTGDTLRFNFDSGWKVEDIRATLRMLQMVERGELIPATEA